LISAILIVKADALIFVYHVDFDLTLIWICGMVQNVDEDFHNDCDWDFQICVGDMTYDLQTQGAAARPRWHQNRLLLGGAGA